MTVYYEDDDVIVCEKPYGVSSQKSNGESMINLLENYTQGEVFPIHRLDITTTGVVVYAKNKKSAAMLCQSVSNGNFSKEYLCVCHGNMPDSGEMQDYLYHDKIRNKSFVKNSSKSGAKLAKLEFYTLGRIKTEENSLLSLVKVKLLTGRTHQIRVQFSSRACPLYGDGKYGAKDNDKTALHSHKISFDHPVSNKRLEFVSYPNGEIWRLFDK